MVIIPNQDVYFNDQATFAMGAAFDQACDSIWHIACTDKVRESIAKRIIEAAIDGERDPIRLRSRALMGFSTRLEEAVPIIKEHERPEAQIDDRSIVNKSWTSAAEMAGKAIDQHTDRSASPDEQESRKRRLVKGPEEFRDLRRVRSGPRR